jgi:hypothetical protein
MRRIIFERTDTPAAGERASGDDTEQPLSNQGRENIYLGGGAGTDPPAVYGDGRTDLIRSPLGGNQIERYPTAMR